MAGKRALYLPSPTEGWHIAINSGAVQVQDHIDHVLYAIGGCRWPDNPVIDALGGDVLSAQPTSSFAKLDLSTYRWHNLRYQTRFEALVEVPFAPSPKAANARRARPSAKPPYPREIPPMLDGAGCLAHVGTQTYLLLFCARTRVRLVCVDLATLVWRDIRIDPCRSGGKCARRTGASIAYSRGRLCVFGGMRDAPRREDAMDADDAEEEAEGGRGLVPCDTYAVVDLSQPDARWLVCDEPFPGVALGRAPPTVAIEDARDEVDGGILILPGRRAQQHENTMDDDDTRATAPASHTVFLPLSMTFPTELYPIRGERPPTADLRSALLRTPTSGLVVVCWNADAPRTDMDAPSPYLARASPTSECEIWRLVRGEPAPGAEAGAGSAEMWWQCEWSLYAENALNLTVASAGVDPEGRVALLGHCEPISITPGALLYNSALVPM